MMDDNMTAEIDELNKIKVIFSADQIQQQIGILAKQIAAAKLKEAVVIAILKGSFIFAADLIRSLHAAGLAPQVDFISLSSYNKGTKSSGHVNIIRDVDIDIAGRDVVLVDDILESGRTLHFAKELLQSRNARSISSCVLLNKRVARAAPVEADYIAFECPELFVVGYGMDKSYKYRQLPFIGYIPT